MQEGTFQEATPDMLSALPRSSSLTRSTDGEVRASLGAGDARRLDRLLHGACSAGSAADDGVSALPDYSPESCIDGPMGDVLEYAAMSSLIADCYSGLSSTSASPSPTRPPTAESLAVGPLASFAAGAIAEGIIQWGAQEGATRLLGFVFSSHDFPSATLGDTTAFFTEERGLHNYSVTITHRVEGSDGSQQDVRTKAYFEVNADGEKSIGQVVVERPDGSRIDAQRYDDRWGIDRFRVTETRLGREVGASNLSIWRENGPNGQLVANCSGSANTACAEIATSLGAKRVTNREEGAHHGVEPGGADLTRESCRELATMGVLGGGSGAAWEALFGGGVVPSRSWYERPTGEGVDPTTQRHIDSMRCVPTGGEPPRSPADRVCGLTNCNLGSLGSATDTGCACVRRPAGFTQELANELVRCYEIGCPPGSRTEVSGSTCVCVADETPAGRAQCDGPPRPDSDFGTPRPFCPGPPSGGS
jgi:hypothetical protein